MGRLDGKQGLVIGMANRHSIAWGCARAFRDAGAELGPSGIRVNAVSPGPLATRAGAGGTLYIDAGAHIIH